MWRKVTKIILDSPTNYFKAEGFASSAKRILITFNLNFPDSGTDHGLYFYLNGSDDTSWNTSLFSQGSDFVYRTNWITPKPLIAATGWKKPTVCAGNCYIINPGVNEKITFSSYYSRFNVDRSNLTEVFHEGSSLIDRQPYSSIEFKTTYGTVYGFLNFYEEIL